MPVVAPIPSASTATVEQRESRVAAQQPRAEAQVVHQIGIEGELAPQPGGVVKRSEDASKHVELLLWGEGVAGGEPGAAASKLGFPFPQPPACARTVARCARTGAARERQAEHHAGFHRRGIRAPRVAMARNLPRPRRVV